MGHSQPLVPSLSLIPSGVRRSGSFICHGAVADFDSLSISGSLLLFGIVTSLRYNGSLWYNGSLMYCDPLAFHGSLG